MVRIVQRPPFPRDPKSGRIEASLEGESQPRLSQEHGFWGSLVRGRTTLAAGVRGVKRTKEWLPLLVR
jgi:hypothetical protein